MLTRNPNSEAKFAKVLSRREVLTLSFGAMIGWSWVLLTGDWLQRAGTFGALLAFAVGGIAILAISLTYAELVAALPKAGGEHVYTERALGRTLSFVCTWSLVMGYVAVPVYESSALATGLEYLFPDSKSGLLWSVAGSKVYSSFASIGIFGSVLMTWINIRGIKTAAIVQSSITVMFFLVGLGFFAGGLGNAEFSELEPLWVDGIKGSLGVLIMVPALMVGFDVIPQSAEEINLKPSSIGRVLVVSVLLAVLWYALITLSVAFAMGPESLLVTKMATADANALVWDSAWAGNLMVVAGIGGILTSWNAFVIGGSRVIYALAESRLLPEFFARLHPRYQTPYAAILLIGGLSCISPFFGRNLLVWLLDASSFAIVIAYGMVAWAFVRLRRQEPDLPRPFRVPCGLVVGYAALGLSIALGLLYLPWSPSALIWPQEWGMLFGWASFGLIMYALANREKRIRGLESEKAVASGSAD